MLLKKILSGIYYFTLGHIIMMFHYDRKYCTGKFFKGKLNGLCSNGWKWVVHDYQACRKLHVNKGVPWPTSAQNRVIFPENIVFHPDDLNNFQSMGIYYQAAGNITIGYGTYIAPNVGLITANHTISNLDAHDEAKPIILGEHCWIGMNSIILPGCILGDHTVVGAGSVVTKSFPEGNCIIAGNPAKIIKLIEDI